jgi:aminomethyltransferase
LSIELKKVFLNNYHKDKNAKFVAFAGYLMPINYDEGIIKEHLHVRSSVGVFDVSHMGQILILISDSNILNLEKYIPLNLKTLKVNKSYYSFILNNEGGVTDDIIISKITYDSKQYFFIVYNSSRKEVDEKIFITNLSDYILLKDNSLIAIQGPFSNEIVNFLPEVNNLNFMNSLVINYQNHFIIVSRSGYTGEDGFEISVPNLIVLNFIKQIMKNQKAKLCGLGSRDSLRLEAGLCLYGNELDDSITPIEANLNWAINKNRLNDKNLNGNKILLDQFFNGTKKFKIAIKCLSKSILRNDMKLFDKENNVIGRITSGAFSPIIKSSIGIGYIDIKLKENQKIYTLIRNNIEELEIVKLPFVLHNYKKGH